jgi:hypothetical protein
MMNENVTGTVAANAGEYASLCHRDCRKLKAGETFPACRTCGGDATWEAIPPFDAIDGMMANQNQR